MSLLNQLNPAQGRAVEIAGGPILVLAGAGSGKTRVLTHRIAHLVRHHHVPPRQILAATFTNKAAGEMRERIEDLVGPAAADIWIGTFHAICARILRYESAAFGLHPSFTIYDEEDRRALLRQVLASLAIDDDELTPRVVAGHISRAKNAMVDVETFTQRAGESRHRRRIAELYAAYEVELKQSNALDFDDLIVEPVRQFQQHPDVLGKYRDRFLHILVDEYQDTNRPQYLLAGLLAQNHRNICCVGDDDQSIYQFRGADIRNILDFERDYPEAQIVRLEQNYRSTGRILKAANAVIRHNRDRKGKTLWTESHDGALIKLAECASDRVEARHIVSTVSSLCREEDLGLDDAAVLYRTNAQSRALEEELQRAGMPYNIVGNIRFYERREVKDVLSYLRLVVNPADNVALLRIINVPKRGIGNTTIARLRDHAENTGASLVQVLNQLETVPGLGPRAQSSLGDFRQLVADLAQLAGNPDTGLPELAEELLERSGYLAALREGNAREAQVREENVAQLVARITEFAQTADEATLSGFLEEVALMTPADESSAERECVTLMTLHMAKGLEFPIVAIAGLEENLFPTARTIEESHGDPGAMEEERRLFYVGITRARRRLLLTCAHWRYTYGSLQEAAPSRFLLEVPEELVAREEIADETGQATRAASRLDSRRRARQQPVRHVDPQKKTEGVHYEWDEPEEAARHAEAKESGEASAEDGLAVGCFVRHPVFGHGRIAAREGNGDDTKLTVDFGGRGVKRILVAYAQLSPA